MKIYSNNRGFTLIELVVTVVLIGVIAAFGIPSFNSMVQNNRLASQTNELITALQYARSEAISRAQAISVCPTSDQTSCTGNTDDWEGGWIVFVDTDEDGTPNSAADVIRIWQASSGSADISGASVVRYLARGQISAGAQVELQVSLPDADNDRCIRIAPSGRLNTGQAAC